LLTILDIQSCYKIKTLDGFPNLEFLNCHRTAVEQLKDLDHLTYLNCSGTGLRELSYMPNLKNLYAFGCHHLSLMHQQKKIMDAS